MKANSLTSVVKSIKCGLGLFATLAIALLFSCGGQGSLEKKIPGWYQISHNYENGDSMVGKMTYYKNGQSQLKATLTSARNNGANISVTVQIDGVWSVRDGELVESVSKVHAIPETLKDYIEGGLPDKGVEISSKIIEVNATHLLVQNDDGTKSDYIRLKKE
jgi:hypothetical protein